jgi:hypothetical protein
MRGNINPKYVAKLLRKQQHHHHRQKEKFTSPTSNSRPQISSKHE